MRKFVIILVITIFIPLFHLGGCGSSSGGSDNNNDDENGLVMPSIELEQFMSGFNNPVYLTHSGDGTNRLFVVEKRGVIIAIDQDDGFREQFLDITDMVEDNGFEQGLLSVAFHPSFENNGRFFVYYTNNSGDSVISEFITDEGSGAVNENSEEIILTIEQPAETHNGGQLAFGNDGYLYIGTGDGGFVGDPMGNAQDLGTLLGKILRIDVDTGNTYSAPGDNPFTDEQNARDEIWAYGVRHPWRFSFDPENQDLYIADVGEAEWEEVNYQPSDSEGGENYGWKYMEGFHEFRPPDDFDISELTLPVAEYGHDPGCSVTGGYVYRGEIHESIEGIYFYGDFCSGNISGLQRDREGNWQSSLLLNTDLAISSFGIDENNEIYVLGFRSGDIYRITVE